MLLKEAAAVLEVVGVEKVLEVVVWVLKVVRVAGLIVLPIAPKSISERPQDHVATMILNRRFLSSFGERLTFVVMLDPLDCCSCQSWHPR